MKQKIFTMACVMAVLTAGAMAQERQVTFSAKYHNLDNTHNFSPCGKFLCYDTRGTVGHGIGNGQTIEKVEIATGIETVLYAPSPTIVGREETGNKCAPGLGAAFYCPVGNKVAFIHGPLVEELEERGYYAGTNRRGAEVVADGSQRLTWMDCRDVDTTRDTLPGAHRGGTHDHEYSSDGNRVGLTYDDHLLPEYGRTVAYLEKHPAAPGGVPYYFAILVPVVPEGTSKPGELEKASGDAWIGPKGLKRAFIGKVRNDDGETFETSLFLAEIPADVDITTADSGSATRFPRPPKGTRIRRMTHDWAGGFVRGTPEGNRIAYYGRDENGATQVFIIPTDGSDRDPDPAKRPVQATRFPKGAGSVRWHPSGNSIACLSDGGVALVCVKPGPDFGRAVFLTPQGDEPSREQLAWSPDGGVLAYGRVVPTFDAEGNLVKNFRGEDFRQIFVVASPDPDGDGVFH